MIVVRFDRPFNVIDVKGLLNTFNVSNLFRSVTVNAVSLLSLRLRVVTLVRPVRVNDDNWLRVAFKVTRLVVVETSRLVKKFVLVSSVTRLARPVRVNDDNWLPLMVNEARLVAGDASNDFKTLRLASIEVSEVSPEIFSVVRRLFATARVVKAVRPANVSEDNLLA